MIDGRYKTNPFLADMIVPAKGKQIQLTRLGRDNNVLIDRSTGEVRGTHIVTYKKVDQEQFVKLFTNNIALTFDLSASGIKAFNVLVWAIQKTAIEQDTVVLDTYIRQDFIDTHVNTKKTLKLSQATFQKGLAELVKSKIIAKTIRRSFYWINPNFVFNGDRIAFSTLIEKRSQSDQNNQDNLQLDLTE